MERLRALGLSQRAVQSWEKAMTDLLYLTGGIAALMLFAGYALLLKRA